MEKKGCKPANMKYDPVFKLSRTYYFNLHNYKIYLNKKSHVFLILRPHIFDLLCHHSCSPHVGARRRLAGSLPPLERSSVMIFAFNGRISTVFKDSTGNIRVW